MISVVLLFPLVLFFFMFLFFRVSRPGFRDFHTVSARSRYENNKNERERAKALKQIKNADTDDNEQNR